jgi:hypothetical protein
MPTVIEFVDLFKNISVVVACLIAIRGIDSWRAEFVGKRRMELAEEVVARFYEARDAIMEIRSPFGFGGEGSTRKPSPDERPEDKQPLDQAYVLIERYNRHNELFARIRALRYRFMAQFGKEAARPFEELNLVVNELLASAHQMARYALRAPRGSSEAEMEKYYEPLRKAEKVYWAGFEDDPIAPRVDGIMQRIEDKCGAVIASSGTLHSLVNLKLGGRG